MQDKTRKLYRSFTGLESLKKYAETTGQIDLMSQCMFAHTHGSKTGDMLHWVREHLVGSDAPHAATAGTTHQSKGAEWDYVVVMPEVAAFLGGAKRASLGPVWLQPWRLNPLWHEDVNLLYVAVTRAKLGRAENDMRSLRLPGLITYPMS